MRNAAKHHGRPMIVIAMIAAAITQASAAARPPKISHRMLSRNDSGDMARDLLPIARPGKPMGTGSKHPGAMQVLGPDMSPPQSRTLFELVCEQAERFPERVAVICGERVATYRALADAA